MEMTWQKIIKTQIMQIYLRLLKLYWDRCRIDSLLLTGVLQVIMWMWLNC